MNNEGKIRLTVRVLQPRKDLIDKFKGIMGHDSDSQFFNHLFNQWYEEKGVLWLNQLKNTQDV